jgi:hypothetical protein
MLKPYNILWMWALLVGCTGYNTQHSVVEKDATCPALTQAKPTEVIETQNARSSSPPTSCDLVPELAGMLDYFRYIRALSANALVQEYVRAQGDYAADKSSTKEWRLALLLSLPDAPFHDAGRSVTLLKDLSAPDSAKDSLFNGLISLFDALITIQQQDAKKIHALGEAIKELQTNNKTLQDQLQTLKDIEQSLYQREKNGVTDR